MKNLLLLVLLILLTEDGQLCKSIILNFKLIVLLYSEDKRSLIKKGIIHLLQIKDSDIRLANLSQCRYSVDSSIHIGGASSATIPMVSLFYGGIIDVNVEQPTATDQDMFVF